MSPRRLTLIAATLLFAGCNLFAAVSSDGTKDAASVDDRLDSGVEPDGLTDGLDSGTRADSGSLPDTADPTDFRTSEDTGVDLPPPDAAPAPDVPCTPETDTVFCQRQSYECGILSAPDNCGAERTVGCGTCAPEAICDAGVCQCPDDATLCATLDIECGVADVSSLCPSRATANCGPCDGENICGGGGVPNVCGCPDDATLCSSAGADCGTIDVSAVCANKLTAQCGTCATAETCSANQCSCGTDAEVCAALATECGTVDVSAYCPGRTTVDCGGCPLTETCLANNRCSCVAEDDATFCARTGAQCGAVTADDNCGAPRTVDCGVCPALGESCINNMCCVVESDQAFCTRLGAQCGSVSGTDNCGAMRTASCGACPSPAVCDAQNQCSSSPLSWQWVGNGNSTVAGTVSWTTIGTVPSGTTRLAIAVWAGEKDATVTGDQTNYSVTIMTSSCTRSDAPYHNSAQVEGECIVAPDASVDILYDGNYPASIIEECDFRYTAATGLVEFQDTNSLESCSYAVFAEAP